MSRPSKSARVLHPKSQTKDEINTRIEMEDTIKGGADKLQPPSRLNPNQRKIYKNIVAELEASKILGNLDTYMLELGCIAIDRLQNIEEKINNDISYAFDKDVMNAKAKYTNDFLKFCQETCLSPQSRAKMGIMAANKKLEEADPLLKVLKKKSS